MSERRPTRNGNTGSTVPPWARDATTSSEGEVADLNPALSEAVNLGVRHDTASTDDEAAALMRRLRQIEPEHVRGGMGLWRPALLSGGLLLAGAAAAAGVIVGPTLIEADTFVDAPTPTALRLEVGRTHAINADITVTGLGDLSIDRLHDQGADLSLVQGLATFEVDPQGTARKLVVGAGDVEVSVKGTVFTVKRLGDDIEVDVERGEVAVRWADELVSLTAGQSWTRGGGVAAAVPVRTVSGVDDGVVAGEDQVDEAPEIGVEAPESSGTTRPVAAAPVVREAAGQADAEPEDGASSEPGPCEIDSFSVECARSRVAHRATPPETLYENMKRAMPRVDANPVIAAEVVEEANQFLEKHGETGFADDVRAFRVQAAFYGTRSSQTIGFAAAFLASASADHPQRAEVERMRRTASFRISAVDAAERDCTEADPMLAELVRLETGSRRNEALARRGVCAWKVGDSDKALRILSEVQAATLPPVLKRGVRDAWADLVPEPRER